MSVSSQLQQKREEKNLSQKDLAVLLVVNPEDIRCWEEGLDYQKMEEAQVLCQLLGISMDDLANDDDIFKELMLETKVEKQVNKVMSILGSIMFFIVFLYGIYKLITSGLDSGVIVILAISVIGGTHFLKETYKVVKNKRASS